MSGPLADADIPTWWEWADPEPARVSLEMVTDQAGAGRQFATQVGWREGVARTELTGDPTSPVTDTRDNPPAPERPAEPPAMATVVAVAADPTEDSVVVTRTDTRPLDGFDYQCFEYLGGARTATIGPAALPASGAGRVTVPGTKSGHAYECVQRGWVKAVQDASNPPAVAGQRFDAGVSEWSPVSVRVTRRAVPTTVTGSMGANGVATFTWQAVTGAEGWQLQWQRNSTTEAGWISVGPLPAGQLSWSTPVVGKDTRVYVRVRPVNASSDVTPWASASADRPLDAPVVSVEAGVVGKAAYVASWPHVESFDPAVHDYEYQYKIGVSASAAWSVAARTDATSFTVSGVLPGRSVWVRVRAVGAHTGATEWREADTTRPVAAPAKPSISISADTSGIHSSAGSVSCEAGTTVQYRVHWSNLGWVGWGSGQSSTNTVAEGVTASAQWQARCVATEGSRVAEGPGSDVVSARRPYTAPAVPSLSNPSDGNVGTNITFSWSGTGGYYQVVDSSYSHRGYTTGTSLTVARESGSTCARVRAARNAEAASEGVWSGWSSLQCGATLIPVPQAPASGWVHVSGARSMGIYASWSAVTYATQYRWELFYSSSGTTFRQVDSGTTTSLSGAQVKTGAGYAYACVQPGNSTGWGVKRCSSSWHIPDY